MRPGSIYLLPTGLGSSDVLQLLPPATIQIAHRLTYFVAEQPKSARAFLKSISHPEPLQTMHIETLDEHTPQSRIPDLLDPIHAGTDCGVLSEAGCPAVADPGSSLVRAAHAAGLQVIPLVGPSAILLALMAAGLEGQRFCFNGYLPVERTARAKRIAQLEGVSERERSTQMFIETPYRNDATMATILETCRPDTLLCVAAELTCPGGAVQTKAVAEWRKTRPVLDRRPTVFLLYSPPR